MEVDVEKVHVVVAQRAIPSQDVQSAPRVEHLWKLRLGCFRPFLEVEMSKKCTPLWREANVEVQRVKKFTGSEHFLTFRYRFAWQAQGIPHLVKSEQNVRVL